MKSLNVRLTAADAENIRTLRAAGVSISDVVRAAIRTEAQRHGSVRRKGDVLALLHELDAKLQQREIEPHHGVDLTNRSAVADHIRQGLRAKKRRIIDDLARHERPGRTRRSA
jgi:Arc/MetJ-type ribon-helix-helix transcriptional regulator